MRRFWIMVTAVLACVALAAQVGVAYASDGGTRPTVSCSSLVKKYRTVNKDAASINFNNPQSLSNLFKKAGQEFKNLASSGPSQLRSAFKDLGKLYTSFAQLDFSNSATFAQLSQIAQDPYRSDLQKIGQYFQKQCNFTIPTT